MNKHTLYIHIGITKTGSTTIQTFLIKNRELLSEYGICFPNNILPELSCGSKNATFVLFNRESKRFKKAIKNLEKILISNKKTIISEEIIAYHYVFNNRKYWYQGKKIEPYNVKDNISYIYKYFKEKGYNVKVLVYLRRQDKYLLSDYSENIKADYCNNEADSKRGIISFLEYMNEFLDYYLWIDNLSKVVNKEDIIVRSFDNACKRGLCLDFLNAIDAVDVTKDQRFKEVEPLNKSLELNAIRIKSIINNIKTLNDDQRKLFSKAILNEGFHHFDDCSLISKEEAIAIVNKFQPGNIKLSEEYLNGYPLFDEDYSNYKFVYDPNNEYFEDDLRRFITFVDIRNIENNKKHHKIIKRIYKVIRARIK